MSSNKPVRRVLICQGDRSWRERIREVVEGAGHEVVAETETARMAFEVEERLRPDVLVTGLKIPEYQDAFAMMSAICGRERKVPRFIIVSGDDRLVCVIPKTDPDMSGRLAEVLDS